MTRSGRDPRTPSQALAGRADSTSTPGPRNSTSNPDRRLRVLVLVLLGHMLRSRRFYERVAFAAIVMGALGGMGQEKRAKSFARMNAWVKRQDERVERKLKSAVT
jgi:hypothetical protein